MISSPWTSTYRSLRSDMSGDYNKKGARPKPTRPRDSRRLQGTEKPRGWGLTSSQGFIALDGRHFIRPCTEAPEGNTRGSRSAGYRGLRFSRAATPHDGLNSTIRKRSL
jgi:hypothetical protein